MHTNTHGFTRIHTDAHGYARIPTEIKYTQTTIHTDTHGIHTDTHGYAVKKYAPTCTAKTYTRIRMAGELTSGRFCLIAIDKR